MASAPKLIAGLFTCSEETPLEASADYEATPWEEEEDATAGQEDLKFWLSSTAYGVNATDSNYFVKNGPADRAVPEGYRESIELS